MDNWANDARNLQKVSTKATKAVKSKRILDLHIQGYNNKEIHQLTGLAYKTIKTYLEEQLDILQEQTTIEVERYRASSMARYDLVLQSLYPLVKDRNLYAIDRYLKTIRQRDELMGVVGAGSQTNIQINNNNEEDTSTWGFEVTVKEPIETSATLVDEDMEEKK